jgi:acyl-CoA reductase-like NAD-dependent aldehyde dehydrogenase
MNENCLSYGIEISESDWDKTPASVKQLVEKMGQQIEKSEEKLAELEAKQQELKRKNQLHIKKFIISPVLRSASCRKKTRAAKLTGEKPISGKL